MGDRVLRAVGHGAFEIHHPAILFRQPQQHLITDPDFLVRQNQRAGVGDVAHPAISPPRKETEHPLGLDLLLLQ
ncbi:hypothetical protein CSC43_7129 [Pseudomonas aeruginosa]|nr:hypothetical protein CSC43_7129 [Pseudomonas aeruginosa]